MKDNFEYYALHYLNLWISTEKEIFQKMRSNDRTTKYHGIKEGANYFRIARSLPTKYEKEKNRERYDPVLQILETDPLAEIGSTDVIEAVEEVHKELSAAYGNRIVISATSKFLWLRYRDPVKILDSQAKSSLNISGNDYSKFVQAWNREYNELRPAIIKASKRLPSISDFTLESSEYISEICIEEWFLQRVFDIYLWQNG